MTEKTTTAEGGVINGINRFAQRWVPDSYVIALILSLLTFILAWIVTPAGPYKIVQAWGQGFWVLLEFSMQMTLIVITGYALANTPVCMRLLRGICRMPRSVPQVYLWAVVAAAVADYLNWGFGLVFSALLTKELARQADSKGLHIDYPLLCGASWTAFYFWHMGLSGSAPLLVATPTHFMVKEIGVIPVSQTLFSSYTLLLVLLSLIVLIVMYWLILPRYSGNRTLRQMRPDFFQEETATAAEKHDITTPSEWLTYTPWISYVIGIMFLVYLYYHFIQSGKSLDINVLNFIFFMLIVFLYKTPANLLKGVKAATPASAGIILQFPFYAGIFGIMKYTGLVDVLANWLIGLSSPTTFPAITAVLTGIVGYFIPSGGSKWAIEAPFLIPAAQSLGVAYPKAITAYMFGNDWSGLIQPFFAIPFIAVAGIEFKDFAGYSFIAFVVLGILMLLGLTFIPF